MVNELSLKFSSPILILCDSWFGNKSLAKEIGKNFGKTIHVLTKLSVDSVLYDSPKAQRREREAENPNMERNYQNYLYWQEDSQEVKTDFLYTERIEILSIQCSTVYIKNSVAR